MNKRALITGITGMVGSHLADFLVENTDWDIYGMCRWRSPLDNVDHLIDRANKKDRVYFIYGDVLWVDLGFKIFIFNKGTFLSFHFFSFGFRIFYFISFKKDVSCTHQKE